MKTTITVPFNVLKAIALFASKDETKAALGDICFDKRDGEPLNVVATDGRVLARWQDAKIAPVTPVCFFSLSAHFLAPVIRLSPHPSEGIKIEIEPAANPQGKLGFFACVVSWRPSVGTQIRIESANENLVKYPNWRSVVDAVGAAEKPPTCLACNSDLLGKFLQAKKLLAAGAAIMIKQNSPTECAAITFTGVPEFSGLLMPIKM